MTTIFAYGSLLHKSTWSFDAEIEMVSLQGWVRQWNQVVPLDGGAITALSISPHPKKSIKGIILKVDKSTLESIGGREVGYNKTILAAGSLTSLNPKRPLLNDRIMAYTASKETKIWANKKAPILLSYIDVVAQGYFNLYGWEGLLHFFKSTQGWDLPILNDRKAPLYPRATTHDIGFLDLIDQQILLHSKLLYDEDDT